MSTMSANMLGLAGEFKVMANLLLRGHNPAKSYLEDGADIVLENGLRIEVKSARRYLRQRGESYHFGFKSGHQKKKIDMSGSDFVICWCVDEDCFFIIPSSKIKTAVRICNISSSKSQYAIFKENWDLLEKGVKDGK